MDEIPTPQTALDRKLQRILSAASRTKHTSFVSLARDVAARKPNAFMYKRFDRIYHASPQAIVRYVRFSQTIGLLDENLNPTLAGDEIRDLGNFQIRLGQSAVRYLEDHDWGLDRILSKTKGLFSENPLRLPTFENLADALEVPSNLRDEFHLASHAVALVRPDALRFKTTTLIVHPDAINL